MMMADDPTDPQVDDPVDPPKAEDPPADPPKVEDPVDPPKADDPDWRDLLTDDGAKKQAERFTDLDAVFKSNAELRKQISDRIKLPGKDADDREVEKFRKAMGIPLKAEDYKFDLPEGMEIDEGEQALLDAVKPIAHEANVPGDVLSAFIVGFKELETQIVNEHKAELDKHKEASEKELHTEWGKDYDSNVAIANRAMNQFGGEDLVAFLNGAELKDGGSLSNDPQMVRMFAKLGRQMSEDGVIQPVGQDEAKSLDDKANELTLQAHALLDKGDKAGADKLFRERDSIEARLSGDEPITGGVGRAA